MAKNKEGWSWAPYTKRYHYYIAERSLCERYRLLWIVELEQRDEEYPNDCAICRRKLKERKQRQAV